MDQKYFDELEEKGVETVLMEIAQRKHGDPSSVRRNGAEGWVKSKQEAAMKEQISKRDQREEKTLSIAEEALASAKEANRIATDDLAIAVSNSESAKRQARYAMWAAIISVVALIVSNFSAILRLFGYVQGNP